MTTVTKCCRYQEGEFFAALHKSHVPAGQPAPPLLSLGNIIKATLNYEVDTIQEKDKTGRGGYDCAVYLPLGGTIEIDAKCAKAQILRLAHAGTGNDGNVVAGVAVAEPILVQAKGELIPLKLLASGAVTLGGGLSGLVLGVDYLLENGAIKILETATHAALNPIVAGGVAGTVGYPYGEQTRIDYLTELSQEYRIVFNGTNRVDGGKVRQEFYKVKFSLVKSLDVISEGNMQTYKLMGTILKDSTASAAPIFAGQVPSQFGYELVL